MRQDALGLLDHVEAHERNLHGEDRSEDVEGGVGDVQAVRVAALGSDGESVLTDEDHDHDVDRDQIDDEHVTSPGGHHVKVAQCAARRDQQRARIDRLGVRSKTGGHLHPEIEGEQHREDGGGLVIVTTGHGARDVRGNQTHEG